MTNETNCTQNHAEGAAAHHKEVELHDYMEALQIQRRMNKLEEHAGMNEQEQSQPSETDK